MTDKDQKEKQGKLFRVLNYLSELIGWFRIFASPVLIACLLAGIVYYSMESTFGLLLAIMLLLAGFVIGVIWANKVWRSKEGTMWFLSRTAATPELEEDNSKH